MTEEEQIEVLQARLKVLEDALRATNEEICRNMCSPSYHVFACTKIKCVLT